VDATVGAQCGEQEARGPSVWYGMVGTGNVLTVSGCDFDRTFDSGFSIHATSSGCDQLVCLGSFISTSRTCAVNQAGATASFQSSPNTIYYVEVFSFSAEQGFDQNQATTRGFVRVKTE